MTEPGTPERAGQGPSAGPEAGPPSGPAAGPSSGPAAGPEVPPSAGPEGPLPGEPGWPSPHGNLGWPGPQGKLGWPGLHLPRAGDPLPQWLHRAEHLAVMYAEGIPVPAWLRKTPGEHRWPVTLTILAAIVLQVLLPAHLTQPLPRWLLPALEGGLLVGLSIANPVRIERRGRFVRSASIALILLISFANTLSAVLLIRSILDGRAGNAAGVVLANGASVWATNVIAFALWYWEFDRGGPISRALATTRFPDFMFPQMVSPGLAPPEWEPRFVDYLYTSFTNATAFSPTDVMPLARWAKLTMLVQSAVSLSIAALVIARAVNILKS